MIYIVLESFACTALGTAGWTTPTIRAGRVHFATTQPKPVCASASSSAFTVHKVAFGKHSDLQC